MDARRIARRTSEAVHEATSESVHDARSLAEVLVERERARLAAGLHTYVSQELAAARIALDRLRARVGDGALAASLAEIDARLAPAIEAARDLTFELAPPELGEDTLEVALAELATIYGARFGLEVAVVVTGSTAALDDATCALLFQAARELLINTAKHARATCVRVELRARSEDVELVVEDDGRGLAARDDARATSTLRDPRSFGLTDLRVRLAAAGGHLRLGAAPTGG
ncbi:histidine kinase, partial [Myxococcota bacterium]|nr:histidine kinase [Myxococcota bacterium]